MSVVKTLKRARALIVKRGWRQGPGGRLGGPCCADDALGCVAPPGPKRWDAAAALDAALPLLLPRPVPTLWLRARVMVWNDQDGRTKKDVLALYDKAIAAEEAKAA